MDREAQFRGQYDTICAFSGMAAITSFLWPVSALVMGSWPVLRQQQHILSCGTALTSDQKVVGYPHNIHTTMWEGKKGGRITNA